MTDDVVQRIHLDDGVLSGDPDARMQFLILRFGEHRRFIERPLSADTVEKVENRRTPKISQMLIFGQIHRWDAP